MSKTDIPVAVRRQVYERAKGCCEYCLIPDVATFAPHEIDHIIAEAKLKVLTIDRTSQ